MKMKTLIERIKAGDSVTQFSLIPGRVFLDTNILQYLQDFGEYIFEHYRVIRVPLTVPAQQTTSAVCLGRKQTD